MNIYKLRAPVGLFTAIAVVLSTFAVAIPVQAAMPVLSGGGPPNGQTNVPLEAFIDINSSVALNPASVSASTVKLYSCTGATDASSCASPVTATNLCGTVNLENSGTRIVCITSAPLSVSTTIVLACLEEEAASPRSLTALRWQATSLASSAQAVSVRVSTPRFRR